MSIEIAPLTMKPPRLIGLSQAQVDDHYENDYGGLIQQFNATDAELAQVDWEQVAPARIKQLKQDQLSQAGAVILHELYFDSLGGAGGHPVDSELAAAIERDFGSVVNWRTQFVTLANTVAENEGWVALCWSHRVGRMLNLAISDSTQGLALATPLLVLDMFKHAYQLDFGERAGDYIDVFMNNIDWVKVGTRYRVSTETAAPAEPSVTQVTATRLYQELNGPSSRKPVVLDVRLAEDRSRDGLPGTPWRDLNQVEDWYAELPTDRPVVVYCMYGFWVSEDTASALRERGFDARILAGGISAWRGMGLPTDSL